MLEPPPCECWDLKMPPAADMKPVLMCVWHGWYREIEPEDVEEAMRLSDELDAMYAQQATHPSSPAQDGTT